jgi:hypothetical protein
MEKETISISKMVMFIDTATGPLKSMAPSSLSAVDK